MEDLKVVLEARIKNYQKMLQDEGYAAKDPAWDADTNTWDMFVKFESFNIVVMTDLDDPDFVRIMLPNFWDLEPEDLGSALMAADIANKRCKSAKVHLNAARKDTMATVEFLDDGQLNSSKMLLRYLSMCINAAKVYVQTMQEQREAAAIA